MTNGKTIALTRWTIIGEVMSLLFNMLSMLVIAFLPKGKSLVISFLKPSLLKTHILLSLSNQELTFMEKKL